VIFRSLRTDDICVRIRPRSSASREPDAAIRIYDVAVYSFNTLGAVKEWTSPIPQEFLGIPLQATGKLTLKWARYQDLLEQFFLEEKGLLAMYYRLNDALSNEIRDVFNHLRAMSNPICIWWVAEAPELEDMPWELLFYGNPDAPSPPFFNFVRGAPPEAATPVLPLSGPLRLRWSDTPATPDWMRQLLTAQNVPGVVATPFSGSIRQTLREAAVEGVELMHLCSSGSVSLAYEGVLTCSDSDEPPVSAAELSDMLLGSRLSVLGLTAAKQADLLGESPGDATVYRSFAYFGSSRVPLPSIVAPIGPTPHDIAQLFWNTFYSSMGERQRLDNSFASAKRAARASTFALFCRHSHGKLFRQSQEEVSVSPKRMAADLQISLDLSSRLQSLGQKYGHLPDYVTSFDRQETERREDIKAQLNKWSASEGEE